MLDIDFLGDVRSELDATLTALGYSIDSSESADNALINYFNLSVRWLPPVPRTVHQAQSLTCPPHLTSGFAKLLAAVKAGDDLRPYQSRKVSTEVDYDDMLLNDWGVQHFHLGDHYPSGDIVIARTSELLYAIATGTDFYCIAIGDHTSFADVGLLNTVYTEWPTVLDPFILKGVLGLAGPTPTAQERKSLRQHGIVSLVEIAPGVVLHPPGVGYASDGTNIQAVRRMLYYKARLRQLEEHLRQIEPQLRTVWNDHGSPPGDPWTLRLTVENGDFVAYDEIAKLKYRLEPSGL